MKTEIVKVTGMTCDGCTSKVAHALKAVGGVHDVVVSLSAGEAAVRYDESLASTDQLTLAVKGAGYGVGAAGGARDRKSHSHKTKGGCCG